jgi:hypothetical protein
MLLIGLPQVFGHLYLALTAVQGEVAHAGWAWRAVVWRGLTWIRWLTR